MLTVPPMHELKAGYAPGPAKYTQPTQMLTRLSMFLSESPRLKVDFA